MPAGQVFGRRNEALVGALRRGEGPPLQEDEGEEAAQVAGGEGADDGDRSGAAARALAQSVGSPADRRVFPIHVRVVLSPAAAASPSTPAPSPS